MGRAKNLITDLARVARQSGPRAATAAATQIGSRWIVNHSGLGLSTLERRVGEELTEVKAAVTSAAHRLATLDELQARLERQASELADANATIASLSNRVAELSEVLSRGAQQLQGVGAGLTRSADSIRVLTQLRQAELPQLNPSDRRAHTADAAVTISVIVPIYNRADQLAPCVDSILTQDHPSLEVVIVDDGSTDDLAGALEPYRDDPRLIVLNIEHGGEAAARNIGGEASSGAVIVNFDSDNRMYSGYLSRLAAAYSDNPTAMCAMAALVWDDGGEVVHVRNDHFDWNRLLRQEVNLDTNGFSYRRQLRDELGGWDTTLVRHSDWDLALRYTRRHAPLRVDAIAAFYDARPMPDRITLSRASMPHYTRISSRYRPPIDRTLKVLYFCYDYPQLSESYVDTEIAWMTRQGVEIEVVALAQPGSPGTSRVPLHSVDVEHVIEQFRPDLVHCHWLTLVDQVAEAARRRDIPMTVRSHGFEFSPDTLQIAARSGATRSVYVFPHLLAGAEPPHGVKFIPVPACFDSERFYPRIERDRRLVVRAAACLDTKDLESYFHIAAAAPDYTFVLALAKIANLPDLPSQLEALNASLGNPVDLRWDVPHDRIDELMSRAGIYLHTFGFQLPFGMPVSIVEAMACGTIPIVRDSPASRAYAGEQAFYYDTIDDAVAILDKLDSWSTTEFERHAQRCAEFAYTSYVDEGVLPSILNDWLELTQPSPGT